MTPLLLTLLAATVSAPAAPLTLPAAITEARAANAALPRARADAAGARAKADEASAQRYPKISLEGEVQVGRPGAYADSHALARVLATATIFDAGKRREAVQAALADLAGANAGVRQADVSLVLEVRTRFTELLAADEELAARKEALARLDDYLHLLTLRQASGAGVATDLLKTRARRSGDLAELESLRRSREGAAQALNVLLGRVPDAPLALASAPVLDEDLAPQGPTPGPAELVAARAAVTAARAQLLEARAERAPQVDARAELGGIKPMFGSRLAANDVATAPGEGFGGAVGLTVSLPLWDFGAIDARVRQAEASVAAAQARLTVTGRDVRAQSARAASDVRSLAKELELRRAATSDAKDAYLATAALYRGGSGTTLEVLDAYGAWVDATVKAISTHAALREARARVLRWEER
jgi:outer membrane protein